MYSPPHRSKIKGGWHLKKIVVRAIIGRDPPPPTQHTQTCYQLRLVGGLSARHRIHLLGLHPMGAKVHVSFEFLCCSRSIIYASRPLCIGQICSIKPNILFLNCANNLFKGNHLVRAGVKNVIIGGHKAQLLIGKKEIA